MQHVTFWCEVHSYAGGFKVTAGNTEDEAGATVICATLDQVRELLTERLAQDLAAGLTDLIERPTLRREGA